MMDNLETNTKKYIISLLTSTPLAVTILQLGKDYRNTIGEPIPYQKLGYNSLEHFLRSINDTVQVKGMGWTAQVIPIVSEKSAHVNSLVSNQRVPKPKNRQHFQQRRLTYYPSNSNPPSVQPAKKIYYPPTSNSFLVSKSSSPSSNSFDQTNSVTFKTSIQPESSDKRNLTSVNTLKPLNSTSLIGNVEKWDVNNLRHRKELGGSTQLQDAHKLDDKPPQGGNVDPKKCSSVRNILKKVTPDKSKSLYEQENKVPHFIRNNLKTLIKQYPEGVWCAEVPSIYKRMFRQDLNYQELDFNSLIELCVSLPSIFHYVRPTTEDFKLYDRSRPLPDCAEKKFTVASYGVNKNGFLNVEPGSALPSLPSLDWTDMSTYMPQDIFKPGEEIPRAFVSPDVQENDNIDVVVGEIYDLSKFWIYLEDSQLNQLMDDMQEFYRDHAMEYYVPDHVIKEGLYCVQVIFGEYHRALIVDAMPELEDTIRVIFIDYGTMAKVSSKGLCFLHLQFATLPAQAIRCRLANVFPLEEGVPWSREASKAFRKLIADRDTTAKISRINWEDQFLEVYLADVTDENNIFYINDKLVQEGFAQYPEKERRQPIVDPIYTPIVKFIHLFPTFLELEHGLAPSTAEMEVFHECNVPINFCYPQYFYVDYSREEKIIKAAEAFHERSCMKVKRRVATRFYDLEKFKAQELDLSIFGALEPEIAAFVNRPDCAAGDATRNSDEDFVDADEDFINSNANLYGDIGVITEQLRELHSKEEETVSVLKRDLLVTEDIMKDINSICQINNLASAEKQSVGAESSDSLFEEGSGRTLWTINETRESINMSDSVVSYNESSFKTDLDNGEAVTFKHPLSILTFDKHSEDELSCSNSSRSDGSVDLQNNPSYDLVVPDVQLLPTNLPDVDCDLPRGSRCDSDTSDNVFKSDLFNNNTSGTSQSNCYESDDLNNASNGSKTVSISCTNPFLDDVNGNCEATSDPWTKPFTLNPNNPFLTFLTNKSDQDSSDSSQGSSTSTVYDSPVIQVKVTHSWSHFEDITPETLSRLGRSLSSTSSSTSSLKVTDGKENCSTYTQTSSEQTQTQPCPQFYPQSVAYGYSQWSLGYANPYYSVRAGYPCEPQYGSVYRPPFAPRQGPPPGFAPLNPLPALPGANYRNMALGLQQPYHSGGSFPLQARPETPMNLYAQYPRPELPLVPYGAQFAQPRPVSSMNPYGQQQFYGQMPFPRPPAQPSGVSTSASVSSVSVNVVSEENDFYDIYNKQLQMKAEGGDAN